MCRVSAVSPKPSDSGNSSSNFGAVLVERYVANNFVTEVEEACGSNVDAACDTKTKLVEAKLEMVRAAGVFQSGAAVSGVHWINTRYRLQRDEIY